MARDVIYEGWLQKEGLGIELIKVDLKDGLGFGLIKVDLKDGLVGWIEREFYQKYISHCKITFINQILSNLISIPGHVFKNWKRRWFKLWRNGVRLFHICHFYFG